MANPRDKEHRKQIFRLVGIKEDMRHAREFEVKPMIVPPSTSIMDLGQFTRFNPEVLSKLCAALSPVENAGENTKDTTLPKDAAVDVCAQREVIFKTDEVESLLRDKEEVACYIEDPELRDFLLNPVN